MSQEEYLRELAGRVCIHMPGWDVGRVQPTAFQLNGADGRGIIFWAGGVGADIRLEVTGVYDLNAYIKDEDKPRITVSAKRGGEAIAKDVQRRFLPKYENIYARALKSHSETMRLREARARVMRTLAEAFGWNIIRERKGLAKEEGPIKHVEEGYGRSKVDAHYTTKLAPESERRWEVGLDLRNLTMHQALRIADVLKEPAFPPEQLGLL